MKLTPYLAYNGNCAEAIKFYCKVLNAKVLEENLYGDSPMAKTEAERKRVLHAHLEFEGNELFLCDGGEDMQVTGGLAVTLTISPDKAEDVDSLYEKLLGETGESKMAPQDTFWNARFASLVDPFGIIWSINFDKGA